LTWTLISGNTFSIWPTTYTTTLTNISNAPARWFLYHLTY
jgi:hypothetical protein